MKRAVLAVLLLVVVGCGHKTTGDWLAQLKDPDVTRRRQAIRELGAAGHDAEKVVPALAEALKDESPYVRHDAATTLPKFGDAARSAVPGLKTALKDKDQNVRHAADLALKKIAPGRTS